MQRANTLNNSIPSLPFSSPRVFLFCCILLFSLGMGIVHEKDWGGWLMVLGTFIPLFLVDRIRSNPKLFWALFITLCAHQLISIANIYIFPGHLIQTFSDSKEFHDMAIETAKTHQFLLDTNWYVYSDFLALFYMICPSLFLGQELSILAFVFNCILILKLIDLFKISKYDFLIIFLFGILPSQILFSSILYRESWMLFLFLLGIYNGYLWYNGDKAFSKYTIYFLGSCFLLSFLHVGMAVYMAFFIMLYSSIILVKEKNDRDITSKKLLIAFISFIILLLVGFFIDFFTHDFITNMFFKHDSEKFNYLVTLRRNYLKGIALAHTTYPYGTKSKFSIIIFYMCYLFGPFTQTFKGAPFLIVALISWIRTILIALAIRYMFMIEKTEKRRMLIFLMIYFTFTFFWSYGTNNYGTAIRHNLVTDWLIILIGIKGFDAIYNNFLQKKVKPILT